MESEAKNVLEPSLELPQDLQKEIKESKEIKEEIMRMKETKETKEIPTVGRTQRFLRETMTPRSDTQYAVSDPKAPWGTVDCVFCNFPWGENIFEYYNETENILTNLGKELRSGCECAFITKRPLLKEDLLKRRFIMTKEIPIRDDLKRGRKMSSTSRKSGRDSSSAFSDDDKDNTGDCFVTFAIVA